MLFKFGRNWASLSIMHMNSRDLIYWRQKYIDHARQGVAGQWLELRCEREYDTL
jgi:hypothetical protein